MTSYGAIAKALGTGSSARMVGWAMNAAHNARPKVPAHRVVNQNRYGIVGVMKIRPRYVVTDKSVVDAEAPFE